MAIGPKPSIALWAVTPNGLKLAQRLQNRWPTAALFYAKRLAVRDLSPGANPFAPPFTTPFAIPFDRLTETVAEQFNPYDGHIFIMATGIVVRSIAPLLNHKTVDPAVVVVDDGGQFAISLTAGHLGGANLLAEQVALCLKATPVITSATDVNGKAAIDLLAVEHGLKIENPSCIKAVNMALLTDTPIRLHDPDGRLGSRLPDALDFSPVTCPGSASGRDLPSARVWIGDTVCDLPPDTLVLRPPSLVAGVGCNRHTPQDEIRDLLLQILEQFALAPNSLTSIASIDLKSDEQGILELAEDMELSLAFFSKKELARVDDVPTPSTMVTKHVGVPSVCEAAAILASGNGPLIVPKHRTKNVTVAIARTVFMSSASDRAT
jgi:cobalt-precorrin 5A hydrolase